MPGEDSLLYHTPNFYGWIVRWYYAAPAVAVIVGGLFLITIWRVWFEARGRSLSPLGKLPVWPLNPRDKGPGIVVGEKHHPVECREIFNPSWLVIPERGLYTGAAIFGTVGSGKTSACMHPFAEQILSWQAGCGEDYLEITLEGLWQWNPLDDTLLDSYLLAYTVSTRINQLLRPFLGHQPFAGVCLCRAKADSPLPHDGPLDPLPTVGAGRVAPAISCEWRNR